MAHEHEHFMVLVGNLDPGQRTRLATLIADDACTWFNYTTDAWLVCTTSTGEQLTAKLRSTLSATVYFVLFKLDAATAVGGMLPPEAWKWLRTHNLVR